jgi:hypothetical protein
VLAIGTWLQVLCIASCVETTRVWGPIGSAEIFAEGTAYTATKWDVHRAGLARYRQGVMGG